jgi:hypothetical protein
MERDAIGNTVNVLR